MFEKQRTVTKKAVSMMERFGISAATNGIMSTGIMRNFGSIMNNPIFGVPIMLCGLVASLVVSEKIADDVEPKGDEIVDTFYDFFDADKQAEIEGSQSRCYVVSA